MFSPCLAIIVILLILQILTINLTLKILSDSIFTLYFPGISAVIGTGLGWKKKQLAILLNL